MKYEKHGDSKIIRHNNILIISLKNGFNKEGLEALLSTLQDQRNKLNKEPFFQIMIVDEMALATGQALEYAFANAADSYGYNPKSAFLVTRSIIVKDLIEKFQKRPESQEYPYYFCNDMKEVYSIMKSEKYLNDKEISSLNDKLKEIRL